MVRRTDHDDLLVALKAVHFGQKLVKSASAGRMFCSEASRLAHQGINLVDEDYARCLLASLLEQLAHSLGTHADEHLVKLRAGTVYELDTGLASDSSREQRLTSTRATGQKYTLVQLGTFACEFVRVLDHANELLNFSADFTDALDVSQALLHLVRLLDLELHLITLAIAKVCLLERLKVNEEAVEGAEDKKRINQVDSATFEVVV